MTKLTFSEKVGLAAGSASLAMVPAVADAGLVVVNPAPGTIKVSLADASGTVVAWDVDGIGGKDFDLLVKKVNHNFTDVSVIELNNRSYVSYGNYNQFNGRGFVAQNTSYGSGVHRGANVLPGSFNVGPTLAAPYMWGPNSQTIRRMVERIAVGPGAYGKPSPYGTYTSTKGKHLVSLSGPSAYSPVGSGDYFVGFRFQSLGSLLYGIAEVNIDLTLRSFEILRWAYNDIPSQPISVTDLDAPPVASVKVV